MQILLGSKMKMKLVQNSHRLTGVLQESGFSAKLKISNSNKY